MLTYICKRLNCTKRLGIFVYKNRLNCTKTLVIFVFSKIALVIIENGVR